MSHKVDVAIIGASLAGASTALTLAREGFSTVLIDRRCFPRAKACGEGLSTLGIRELQTLGLESVFSALPQSSFSGFSFIEQNVRTDLDLSRDGISEHGVGVERAVLDSALIEAVRERGNGEAHFGEAPHIRRRGDGSFDVSLSEQAFHAEFLVIATGANPKVPRALKIPERRTGKGRSGLRIPLRLKDARVGDVSLVKLLLMPGMQAFFTRTGATSGNLCVLASEVPQGMFASRTLGQLVGRLCERLGVEATISGEPQGASGIGSIIRPPLVDRVFLIGDAISQLDPVGGMGMTQALVHGRLGGTCLAKLLRSHPSRHSDLRKQYVRELQRELSYLRAYTTLSAIFLAPGSKIPFVRKLRAGVMAREMLLGLHHPSSWIEPKGAATRVLLGGVALAAESWLSLQSSGMVGHGRDKSVSRGAHYDGIHCGSTR